MRFNYMNTAAYVDEVSRDRLAPAGVPGYKELGIKPVKVTEGLAVEMIRWVACPLLRCPAPASRLCVVRDARAYARNRHRLPRWYACSVGVDVWRFLSVVQCPSLVMLHRVAAASFAALFISRRCIAVHNLLVSAPSHITVFLYY